MPKTGTSYNAADLKNFLHGIVEFYNFASQ